MNLKKVIYGVILGLSVFNLVRYVLVCFYNIFNVRSFSNLWGNYPIYGLAWVYYLLMFFAISACLIFFALLLCSEKFAKMKQIVKAGTYGGLGVVGFSLLFFLIGLVMNMIKTSSGGSFISDSILITVELAALVSYDFVYFRKEKSVPTGTEEVVNTEETAKEEPVEEQQ